MTVLLETMLPGILRHARSEVPRECCGLILGFQGRQTLTRSFACLNIQDRLHEEDPRAWPRTAETAYFLDPRCLFDVQREIRVSGEAIQIIYHSHPSGNAEFSHEDRRIALGDSLEPLWPGVGYLIIGLAAEKPAEAVLHEWNSEAADFRVSGRWAFS